MTINKDGYIELNNDLPLFRSGGKSGRQSGSIRFMGLRLAWDNHPCDQKDDGHDDPCKLEVAKYRI